MKVILLEDVKSLGKKGDMVEVNNGYARNFILPKKLGVEATGKNINDLKLQKAHQDKVAAEQLAAARELAGTDRGEVRGSEDESGRGWKDLRRHLHQGDRSGGKRAAGSGAGQKEDLRGMNRSKASACTM